MSTNSQTETVLPRVLISDKEIKEKFEISQPTLWRWTDRQGFPKAVKEKRGMRPYHAVIAWAVERGMLPENMIAN
ncbi:hypothetical protein L3Q72_06535 [Vibrio sp. JC009]|uniref:hypothetical protein n=1 Tax=Vibrio sp. JC009 TaxID=2912314 RepID=UPI0023AEDE73|nr:hypothetical protein [Vibrio sp. JC009]WED23046.1 hypothetical protein L3Q72_06535 [Vibrio sp. JC009]